MGYNMYDKNYGSGFTPESDNRPPEDKPKPSGEYHFSGSSIPRDDGSPLRMGRDLDPQSPSGSSRVNGEYHYNYGFQSAETTPPVTPPPGSSNPPPSQPPRREKRPSGKGRIAITALALILAFCLFGGGTGFLVYNLLSGEKEPVSTEDTLPTEIPAEAPSSDVQISDRADYEIGSASVQAGERMDQSQIYEAYSGSVVSIEVQTARGIGAGTGFVITEDGYVMTCYHVVEGYQALSCTFADTTSYKATYVGGDADADLAILKIEGETPFQPMLIGNSDLLPVGSTVTTIGNALGTFPNTLTSGRVSGLDRALTMSDGTVMNVLQTDCTVNSGNSGGPLFNEYGEVIGVVNAKYSNSGYSSEAAIEGIGFAIPINDAMAILDDLIQHGYITGKPYLGISVSTVSSITAQQYSNMVVGAYVQGVESGSCSEKAGLQVGDIITQVNGTDITTYEELIDAKNALRAGDEMTVTVFRENTYLTMVITLDEEVPESAAGPTEEEQQQQQQQQQYGYDPFGGFFDPYSFFGRGW
ncbi:MAG: trypsin-like peptidase domain-containing protein [Oscillospiraceae bacterium]|nr:trypsin-like peptidase domain-containing protein [Oscillospiraceae bacterium]